MHSKRSALLILAAIIGAILISDSVRESIQNSLALCAQILIPALFPFFVLSGMLLDFGLDLLVPPPIAAFLIGLICGYPLGSRTVCDYFMQGKLNTEQANGLLMCTANASPAFVVIAVGSTVLENKTLGYTLLLCQSIAAAILFCIFVPDKLQFAKSKAQTVTFSASLISNIKKSGEQLLFVCACTAFFGIAFDLLTLSQWMTVPFFAVFTACTELLHGITLFHADKLYLIAPVLGFSGFSVLMQCAFFVRKTTLQFHFVVVGKLMYGILLPALLCIFCFPSLQHKILAGMIIILTNTVAACIIKGKGCEKENDFFKRHRKMLCLLRTGHKNRHERTGSVSS